MITLSYGYKKPETSDKGSIFFPALEDNIQQLNDHTHNGSDSSPISALSVTPEIATVLAAAFSNISPGVFRATVTVPGGKLVDNYVISVKDPTTKELIYLRTEKLNSTQFYLYTSVVQNFEVSYGI